jgi:hypothetical protein
VATWRIRRPVDQIRIGDDGDVFVFVHLHTSRLTGRVSKKPARCAIGTLSEIGQWHQLLVPFLSGRANDDTRVAALTRHRR